MIFDIFPLVDPVVLYSVSGVSSPHRPTLNLNPFLLHPWTALRTRQTYPLLE